MVTVVTTEKVEVVTVVITESERLDEFNVFRKTLVYLACSIRHTEECSRICLLLLCLPYMVRSSLQAVKSSMQNIS